MVETAYFLDFIKVDKKNISEIVQEGSVKKPNIFAVNFGRFESYNPDWDVQQILIFEYFMYLSKRYGHKRFTQKYSMLKKQIRCGNDKLKKLIKWLEDEGFLDAGRSSRSGGINHLNRYKVNFDVILASLEKIYDFSDMPKDQKTGAMEVLTDYIKYHSENTYKNQSSKAEPKTKTNSKNSIT